MKPPEEWFSLVQIGIAHIVKRGKGGTQLTKTDKIFSLFFWPDVYILIWQEFVCS